MCSSHEAREKVASSTIAPCVLRARSGAENGSGEIALSAMPQVPGSDVLIARNTRAKRSGCASQDAHPLFREPCEQSKKSPAKVSRRYRVCASESGCSHSAFSIVADARLGDIASALLSQERSTKGTRQPKKKSCRAPHRSRHRQHKGDKTTEKESSRAPHCS